MGRSIFIAGALVRHRRGAGSRVRAGWRIALAARRVDPDQGRWRARLRELGAERVLPVALDVTDFDGIATAPPAQPPISGGSMSSS